MIIKRDKTTIQNYFEDNSGVVGLNADFVAITETEKDVILFLSKMSKLKVPLTIAGALTERILLLGLRLAVWCVIVGKIK
jgi:hypothetical protein